MTLNYILLQTPDPLITDWIQAIGILLGVPTTVYGIFKLFLKDKQRDAEVKALTDMVKNLEIQTREISQQTSIFQTELLLQQDIAKANFLPVFRADEYSLNKRGLMIQLQNIGQKAVFHKIGNQVNLENYEWHDLPIENTIIDSMQMLNLMAYYKPYHDQVEKYKNNPEELELLNVAFPIPSEDFKLDIFYSDALGNMYKQHIEKGRFINELPIVSTPTKHL